MKTNRSSGRLIHQILAIIAITSPYSSLTNAEDFTADVVAGSWASQPWVSESGGVPGTSGDTPSTADVWIYRTAGSAINIQPGTSLNLRNFTRVRLEENDPGDSIRFQSGSSGSVLKVEERFYVQNSSFYLRSHQSYTTRFTVETGTLEIGNTEWNDAAPDGKAMAVLFVSGKVGSNDYSRITLKVHDTLTLIGNGRFAYEGVATGLTDMDLGDVVFRDNAFQGTNLESSINLGSPESELVEHRVKLRSLSSDSATSSLVWVGGEAVAEIYGNGSSGSPSRYYGQIRESVRVEKTGTNTQVFSRSAGNSYTGGTLVSAGTLLVENTTGSGLGTGSVTVAEGGVIGGRGRIALAADEVITVESGGIVAPGAEDESFNTLRIVNATGSSNPALSMQEGAQFTFTLGPEGVSSAIEFLDYSFGALELAPSGIGINLEGELTAGIYQLFFFREGGEGSALVSSGFADGLFINSLDGGVGFTLHYNEEGFGGPGVIALEISPIPEPSTIVFLTIGLGLAGLWQIRRTRRHKVAGQ